MTEKQNFDDRIFATVPRLEIILLRDNPDTLLTEVWMVVHSPSDPPERIQLTEGRDLQEAILTMLKIREAVEEHFLNAQGGA